MVTLEPLSTTLTPAVRQLFRTAHTQYDLYFSGFLHNHLSHGVLSLASLGADDEEMTAHVRAQEGMLETRKEPLAVPVVTSDNWIDSVQTSGNTKATGNFLDYFDGIVLQNDDTCVANENMENFTNTVVEYAFDPHLSSRLVGGAVHPLIHLGYACELALVEPETASILLAEALAMQCTTRDGFRAAIEALEPVETVNTKQSPLTLGENRVLQLLEELRQDEALVGVPTRDNPDKVDYTVSRTDVMAPYYNRLPVEETVEGVQTAFEHLFMAAVVVVFGSISSTKPPRMDFFLAHILTSAVAVRQVLPLLLQNDKLVSPAATLCRFHFVATLVWYRARGSPRLNVPNLLAQPTDLDWDECCARLRKDPSLEVHSLKVLRAIQMAKDEEWAQSAVARGLLPGVTRDNGNQLWLICANLLVKSMDDTGRHHGRFLWLHDMDAWDYYDAK